MPFLLSFTVVMPMSRLAFLDVKDRYVIAVGEVSFKNTLPIGFSAYSRAMKFAYFNSSVKIASITENQAARRHLLATSLDVATQVSVLGKNNSASAAAGLQSDLNRALLNNGLPQPSRVSSLSIVQQQSGAANISQPVSNPGTPVSDSGGNLALGLGMMGLVLGLCALAAAVYLVRRHSESKKNNSSPENNDAAQDNNPVQVSGNHRPPYVYEHLATTSDQPETTAQTSLVIIQDANQEGPRAVRTRTSPASAVLEEGPMQLPHRRLQAPDQQPPTDRQRLRIL